MSFLKAFRGKGVSVNKWRKRHGFTSRAMSQNVKAYKRYRKNPKKYNPH